MVNVTHHRNDWGTWRQILLCIRVFGQRFVDFFVQEVDRETKFVGNNGQGLLVQTLVHGDHDSQR